MPKNLENAPALVLIQLRFIFLEHLAIELNTTKVYI